MCPDWESSVRDFKFKKQHAALAGVAQWIECGTVNWGITSLVPVGVQVWVVGQVPGGEHVGGNQTLIFLSLSFSFPSPLFKNG